MSWWVEVELEVVMAANIQLTEQKVNSEDILSKWPWCILPQCRARVGAKVAPGRNERRKARTRAALLAAAQRLFGEQGFDATTVAEIADAADVAIGSFYNYFDTKDALLGALLHETLAEHLRRMEARRTGVEDPAEAISVRHRHFVRLAREQPEWAWLLVRLDVPYRVTNDVLGRPAMRDLRAGIAAGRFRVADPRLALRASGRLIAVMHALLLDELGRRADSEHAEGVLRSFGLDPPRPRRSRTGRSRRRAMLLGSLRDAMEPLLAAAKEVGAALGLPAGAPPERRQRARSARARSRSSRGCNARCLRRELPAPRRELLFDRDQRADRRVGPDLRGGRERQLDAAEALRRAEG